MSALSRCFREGVLLRAAGARARDAREAGSAALQPGQPRGGAVRGPEEVRVRPQPGAPALQRKSQPECSKT